MDYKSLIKKVSEFGDLVILGSKGTTKTTLLQHLCRTLRADAKNRVFIIETFPKWIHEFDTIGYYVVKDSDVVESENYPIMQQDYTYIQWSKTYTLKNLRELETVLKTQKDVIILIECEDMEKISFVMSQIIYSIYRKQYLRAKANCLASTNEHFWFLVEESHNLLDSTVIAKKVFNKLRKIQNEFRNLNMHLVCVALRLQDLNPRIRTKMSILLSRVSLDDYQLKIRNLLRNSTYRESITTLEKGKFVFPETDDTLHTEPFKQRGKPYEIKFQTEQPKEPEFDRQAYPKPHKKPDTLRRIKRVLKILFGVPEIESNEQSRIKEEEANEDDYTESPESAEDYEIEFEDM